MGLANKGFEALVKKHLRLIMRTRWIFCNFSSGRINTGGLLTFVSKNSAPNEASVSHLSLVDGRASRILISSIDNPGPKGPLGTETGSKSIHLEFTLTKKGSDLVVTARGTHGDDQKVLSGSPLWPVLELRGSLWGRMAAPFSFFFVPWGVQR